MPLVSLSKEERERYSRQILLYGMAGQEKLRNANVIVVGAGGLGASLLPILAASGIGQIHVFDPDNIERSNLGRQLIFREADIGKNKAERAAAFLADLNPHIAVTAHPVRFTAGHEDVLRHADLINEGSDSLATKFLVNDLALAANKPAFIAALGKDQGHMMLVHGVSTACYRCVFDELPAGDIPSCASEGILSAFPAVVASATAHAMISHLLNPLSGGTFSVFEKNHCRTMQIRKRPDCTRHH